MLLIGQALDIWRCTAKRVGAPSGMNRSLWEESIMLFINSSAAPVTNCVPPLIKRIWSAIFVLVALALPVAIRGTKYF